MPVVSRVFAESKEQKSQWLAAIKDVLARCASSDSKALHNLRPSVSVRVTAMVVITIVPSVS